MDRQELIRRLVLDKICDDYENVDQTILEDVTRDATEFNLTITRSDVVAALGQLVAQGLAKAYTLSSTPPFVTEIIGMSPLEEVEEYFETYFLATPQGLDLQLNDTSWWPESGQAAADGAS